MIAMMDNPDAKHVSKVEFWGAMAFVFTCLFAVHIGSRITEDWFHTYLTVFIVIGVILSFYAFFKHFWLKNEGGGQ